MLSRLAESGGERCRAFADAGRLVSPRIEELLRFATSIEAPGGISAPWGARPDHDVPEALAATRVSFESAMVAWADMRSPMT